MDLGRGGRRPVARAHVAHASLRLVVRQLMVRYASVRLRIRLRVARKSGRRIWPLPIGHCLSSVLAGERDSLLRAVEGLERERDDLRGEAVRLGDVERHAAALALEHDQLARAHGAVEGDAAEAALSERPAVEIISLDA